MSRLKRLADIDNDVTREARIQMARNGARATHSRHDPHQTTEVARRQFMSRFESLVDPNGLLPANVRAIRAEASKRAYFTSLAMARWHGPNREQSTEPKTQSRRSLYFCDWCLKEQGKPTPLSFGSRICKRHYAEWRLDALTELAETGGMAFVAIA